MYRVLLAVNGDEERAKQATKAITSLPGISEGIDTQVVILNVFEEFEAVEEAKVTSEELYDETDFPKSVEIASDILDNKGIDIVKRREHGQPADRILAVAEEIDADIIAMSGRKRSPTGKVLFGSVTQSVMLSANCPIIVNIGGR